MRVRAFVIVLFVLAVGFTVGACSNTPTSATTTSSVAVTGAVPAVGASAQFTATATMLDGSTQDVSSTATWTSATYSGIVGNDAITVQ